MIFISPALSIWTPDPMWISLLEVRETSTGEVREALPLEGLEARLDTKHEKMDDREPSLGVGAATLIRLFPA